MRKSKKNESKSKNLHLGFYFTLVVIFIIIVSIVFKVMDTIRRSEFNDNFFTVAIIAGKNAEVISVSPEEGIIKKLSIDGVGSEEALKAFGVPFDSLAESKNEISEKPKSYFSKLIFHQNGLKSDLTMIDLVRLFIFAQGADSGKVYEETTSRDDAAQFSTLAPEWFLDPQIEKDDKSIEITNTTATSGLGNKIAKVITNMGGRVVLVNSSQDDLTKSIIYYNEHSYTVEKLSKLLNIPTEKKELNSISDIVIMVGEDNSDY